MRKIIFLIGLAALGASQARSWTLLRSDLQGWQTNTLTFYVNYTNCPVSNADLDTAIDAALNAWNHIPTASVTLVRSATAATSDVTAFMNGTASPVPIILCDPNFATTLNVSADSIPGTALTTSTNPLAYSGILLNAQASGAANIKNFTAGELAIILAHEVGHVLGLGHSGNTLALMYYSIAGKTDTVITEDDRDGVSFLYPRNEFTNGAFGCAAIHWSQTTPPPWTSMLWSLVWLVTLLLVGRKLANPKANDQQQQN